MPNGCDICQNFRPEANLRDRTLTSVAFGEHTVVLCELHRRIAELAEITTFEELRDSYGESEGRRSYVPRRTGAPSGTSAPQTGERRTGGRRSTDSAHS